MLFRSYVFFGIEKNKSVFVSGSDMLSAMNFFNSFNGKTIQGSDSVDVSEILETIALESYSELDYL